MAENRGTRTALPPQHPHTPKPDATPPKTRVIKRKGVNWEEETRGGGGREGGRYQEELNSLNDLRIIRVDNLTMISPGVKTHKVLVEQVA